MPLYGNKAITLLLSCNQVSQNQKLIHFLQQQISTINERLRRHTHYPNGRERLQRFMFVKLQKYLTDFLAKKSEAKMVIVPGFRGVGKTTLVAQICRKFKAEVDNVLFVSVEEVRNLFGVGIAETMSAYEHILGQYLECIEKPILVFLDEVQSDPKWAVTLKCLFERTTNIFFCCTGSAAVVLQTTPDIARRAVFERMPPMCFTEFQMKTKGMYPTPQLKDNIREAVYFSKDAHEVYERLFALKTPVNQYWSILNRELEVRDYLSYGSLPFASTMPDETAFYRSVRELVQKIITQDLPMLGQLDNTTLYSIKRILSTIAENDTTSLAKLANTLDIKYATLINVFDALEKAELLIKIPPYGSNMSIATKPSKYLFMSPAIRMSFLHQTGQEGTYLARQGRLLEDSIGSHLYREFVIRGGQGGIRYDSLEGGADFILQTHDFKQIIIEVGMGEKGGGQIANSMKRIKSAYGIAFSSSELRVDKELNVVFVPLDYYFLM